MSKDYLLQAAEVLRRASSPGVEDESDGVTGYDPAEQVELQDQVWDQSGNDFFPSARRSPVERLPPGVFEFRMGPGGWWLTMTSRKFEFPYKIYGNSDHIVDRIRKAWGNIGHNLGILLNGVKGTGKTVTAQLVGNWAISQGYPVIVVNKPIPLSNVLVQLPQDCVVIFDEFEKTHEERKIQQALLTTIDGMDRNKHKRLFIFTTNTKALETNYLDRPSRIRYSWEFTRLGEDVIEEIMDDLLRPELNDLRASIMAYLNTRRVLSIDVVKTVIQEVNIFEQDPSKFKEILNLSDLVPKSFEVYFVNDKGAEVRPFTKHFTLSKHNMKDLTRVLTRAGQKEVIEERLQYDVQTVYNAMYNERAIRLVDVTDDPKIWKCHVKILLSETWLKNFPKVTRDLYGTALWLDEKPEGWEVPEWIKKLEKGHVLTESEENDRADFITSGTLYGSKQCKTVLLRFVLSYSDTRRNQYTGMDY